MKSFTISDDAMNVVSVTVVCDCGGTTEIRQIRYNGPEQSEECSDCEKKFTAKPNMRSIYVYESE